MMKKILFLTILLSCVHVICMDAQFRDGASYADLYDSETVAAMKRHVRTLTDSQLDGRLPGSEGEREAALYVETVLKEYGLDMLTPSSGEVFGLKKDNGDTLTSRNIVGYIQGYDAKLRNNYIVVGARLDNLGSMTMTVNGEPVRKIYSGANGNASGLAVMMELARMVQTNSVLLRRSVLFAAFGASTETFAGSWYFLDRSFADIDKIDAMVNLDMLGTGYNGFYAYTSSNEDMNTIVRRLSGELQPVMPELISSEIYPSDHRAFYAKEIPSIVFTTGRYPEHNTERDVQAILDFEMMEKEVEYIYNYLMALANVDDAPVFTPEKASKSKSLDDVVAYYECDQRPTFYNSADPRQFLEKWVYQCIRYPREAIISGTQGRVMVDFVIDKEGKVTDVKVSKSVSPELDAEAVKVISASPKWKPGRVKGEKVKTAMTIPVEFRLEKRGGKPSFGIKK